MAGSLNSPHDFSLHVQNFTVAPLSVPVEAGAEATVLYRLTPHPNLQPYVFQLAVTLFYNGTADDANEGGGGQLLSFASTAYNGTLEVRDAAGLMDGQTFFLYFFILALFLLLGFGAYRLLEQSGMVKKRKPSARGAGRGAAAKIETGTKGASSADADAEWLRGTNAPGFANTRSKTASAKKAVAKKAS